AERADRRRRDAGLVRPLRPGRDDDAGRPQRGDLVEARGVARDDDARRAELGEAVVDVHDERVAVVEDDDRQSASHAARSAARSGSSPRTTPSTDAMRTMPRPDVVTNAARAARS